VTRYWVRAVIALAICALAVIGFDWGIYHLVRTGSCGSSTTYVSTRPCPPGTGGHILALIGGIFGGLIGIGVWATRGSRGRPAAVPLGLIMWALLFVTLTGSVALAAFGPANNDNSGARITAIVFAFVFVPMGLAPVLYSFANRGQREQAVQPVWQASPPTTPAVKFSPVTGFRTAAPVDDAGDPLDRIAKLGELRDKGLITPAEFEAQKKRLLEEL
jgi:hypothetical protein